MRRLLAFATLVAIATLGIASAALGNHEPLGEGLVATFNVTPAGGEIPAGGTISITGACLLGAGAPADFAHALFFQVVDPSMNAYTASTNLPAGSDGNFSGNFAVPVDAPPDDYKLQLSCQERTSAGDPTASPSS